ncbi:deoxynucleoside kinase [Candidatus Woesebacteria bacterium]|nr:deoxynucleoside kinase [Candidatus Woesebacteria bacterium]
MTTTAKSTKTIVIIGNIASGKSTATDIIAKQFATDRIDADDLFQTSNPFRDVYLENMSRWAFTNELWLTVERVKLIKEHLNTSKSAVTIIDSGLLMSWVYTYGHYLNGVITPDEWQLYEQIYTQIAGPVLSKIQVIRLQYDMPTLMHRLKKRGRAYELEFYTEEYLSQIEKGIEALERRIVKEGVPLLTITEAVSSNFEHNDSDRKSFLDQVQLFI